MSGDDRDNLKAADEALVAQAAGGDREAFRELFERYRQRAYRVAWRFLGSHDDALDAVQESFIKVWGALGGFEGRAMFRTWLMRIVTNTCLDRRRGRSLRAAAPLSEEIEETTSAESQPYKRAERPADEMQYRELRTALHKALEQLSEAHRTAFVLHTQEGLTYREIAATLDISEGTVMSRIYHARKNIQKILSNEGVL